jgi:ABC-type transporter Mla maintaining outer membrane lipid asymmetry ATPase subunit MlaF
METPLIEFREVTKQFGDRTILDQVNLKIYENQITTIMGKSGSGRVCCSNTSSACFCLMRVPSCSRENRSTR